MTYPGPVTLTDGRLLLRLPEAGDIPAITEACQDELTARFVPVPVPYTEEHARTFVEQRPERWQADDGEMTWAITDAAGGRLLGMVGLHARDASMREIGFWAAPWARGRGVMTDAARLVLRFGFDVLRLERVEWCALAGQRGVRGESPRSSGSSTRAPPARVCCTAARGWTAGWRGSFPESCGEPRSRSRSRLP